MKLIRMGILCLIGMLAVSFSNVAFAAPNTAPVLDSSKSPVLSTISEDPGAPTGSVGTLVSSLVDFAVPMGQVDNISDGDVGAVTGIAVTTIDSSLTCYYSLNAGTTWTAFGSVSATTARLLASNSANRIYCLPGININGSFPAALTFRAWDQTSGTDGGTADVSINGNDTAFSSATDTISLQVTPVNDPPVAVDDEYTITENASSTILYILNNDYDVDAVLPIALSSAPSANHGVAAFGVDYITYTPDTDYCGDDTFNYLVIDSDGGSDTGTVTVHITCSDTETETPTLEIAAQQSGDSFITTETMHITFTLPEDMLLQQ
jgi:hypothetical protein